jgi:undecaprenyl-diphosphatase
VAAGLLAGSLALVAGDSRPQRRAYGEAGRGDWLWLGLAQALALAPGVSRSGLTLAAARWRQFARPDARRLSWEAAFPVLVGAGLLKGLRVRRSRDRCFQAALGVGAGTSFASTLAARGLIKPAGGAGRLWPFAAYRTGLAALILGRVRRERG